MAAREDNVYMAKLAEQAERYEGAYSFKLFEFGHRYAQLKGGLARVTPTKHCFPGDRGSSRGSHSVVQAGAAWYTQQHASFLIRRSEMLCRLWFWVGSARVVVLCRFLMRLRTIFGRHGCLDEEGRRERGPAVD